MKKGVAISEETWLELKRLHVDQGGKEKLSALADRMIRQGMEKEGKK